MKLNSDQDRSRWIVPHIIKGAGSSLRHMLERSQGKRLFRDYARQLLFDSDSLTSDTVCVMGHFRVGKYAYLIDQGWKIATFVREPLDRLESHFNFLDQTRKLPRQWIRGAIPGTLEEFCLDDRFQNLQSAYIDWPVKKIDFIGIVEEFSEGLSVFSRMTGLIDCEVEEVHSNRFDHSSTFLQLSDSTIDEIKKFHSDDIALYVECKKIWQSLRLQYAT